MDIFAHGLWTAAAARTANRKLPRPIHIVWAGFAGVAPDLFAFAPALAVGLWERHVFAPNLPLAWQLYRISHSLIVFALVFGVVWLLARRPVLELLGWPLHILIDIPSHSLRFFATPFLWPLSDYRFDGISWANRWFMLANYTALLIVYWRNRGQ
jgi:hypothetical protein